jgi:hypothetical protein
LRLGQPVLEKIVPLPAPSSSLCEHITLDP